MAIFKTGGNLKSNTGHFYINFEYKMHLNFGGNFSKKKVCLIVRKIWYRLKIHKKLEVNFCDNDRTPNVGQRKKRQIGNPSSNSCIW